MNTTFRPPLLEFRITHSAIADINSVEQSNAIAILADAFFGTAVSDATGTISQQALTVTGSTITGTAGASVDATGTIAQDALAVATSTITGAAGQSASGTVAQDALSVTASTITATGGQASTGIVNQHALTVATSTITGTGSTSVDATGTIGQKAMAVTGSTVTGTVGTGAAGVVSQKAMTVATSTVTATTGQGAVGTVNTATLPASGGAIFATAGQDAYGQILMASLVVTGGVVTGNTIITGNLPNLSGTVTTTRLSGRVTGTQLSGSVGSTRLSGTVQSGKATLYQNWQPNPRPVPGEMWVDVISASQASRVITPMATPVGTDAYLFTCLSTGGIGFGNGMYAVLGERDENTIVETPHPNGDVLNIRFWIKAFGSAIGKRVRLSYISALPTQTMTGDWQQLTGTFTVSSNYGWAGCNVAIECLAGGSAALAGIEIAVNQSLPPTYGDGDSSGWRWDGVRSESGSTGLVLSNRPVATAISNSLIATIEG